MRNGQFSHSWYAAACARMPPSLPLRTPCGGLRLPRRLAPDAQAFSRLLARLLAASADHHTATRLTCRSAAAPRWSRCSIMSRWRRCAREAASCRGVREAGCRAVTMQPPLWRRAARMGLPSGRSFGTLLFLRLCGQEQACAQTEATRTGHCSDGGATCVQGSQRAWLVHELL